MGRSAATGRVRLRRWRGDSCSLLSPSPRWCLSRTSASARRHGSLRARRSGARAAGVHDRRGDRERSFHTGPGSAHFANASLGNAPELIIALFAVADGLPQVVLGSITGSVVSTTLLVCGGAMLAGGSGPLRRGALLPQLGGIILGARAFLIPSIPACTATPNATALPADAPVSVVLLASISGSRCARTVRSGEPSWRRLRAGRGGYAARSLVLALSAGATAVVSELLVDSLQSFGRALTSRRSSSRW